MQAINRGVLADGGSGKGYLGVSVIIPARNSEKTIIATLDAIAAQDYPGPIEVVIADGSDTPDTAEVVGKHYPEARLIPNPKQTLAPGANAAFRVAEGDIMVRCDAHAILPKGYVSRIVETLERTGASNVGGRQLPVGVTWFERAVAIGMTTPMGTGNARFRLGGKEGPVDTAYLGAFRKEELEEIGGYDEALVRSDDYELNYRLRQQGKTVWFDPELVVNYRPRSTLGKLASQYFDYGRWKSPLILRNPSLMRPRHLGGFMLGLVGIASIILALFGIWPPLATLAALYALTLLGVTVVASCRRRDSAVLLLPLVLATMHLSWGLGFLLPARIKRDSPPSPEV